MHAVDDRLMESGACLPPRPASLLAYQGHDPLGAVQLWSLPPDASTCMMSPSQLLVPAAPPATAGASISNGLAVTIMLQHCISTTATSTALAIAAAAAAAAIYTCRTSSDQSSAISDDDIYGRQAREL